MHSIQYRFDRCTMEAEKLLKGKRQDKNPLSNALNRILPFDKMRVGDSLFFHYAEMIEWQWRDARAAASRINNKLGYPMFAFVKHGDKQLEIVRIK